MTIRPIDVGEEPNDETGDTLRDGGIIINENFAELDTRTAAAQEMAEQGVTDAAHARAAADAAIPGSALGVSVAQLVSGVVPASQLPSFVDDVLEFPARVNFPAVGETGKIYIAINDGDSQTNPTRQYRWSGSAYVLIPSSPGSTDQVPEGSTNQYFTAARVRTVTLAGLVVSNAVVVDTDSLLSALGKLQGQAAASLKVGAFGWNGGTALSQANTVDANSLTTSGFYAFGNGGISLPTNSAAYYLRVSQHGSLFLQEAFGMTAGLSGKNYTRIHNGTSWQAWVPSMPSVMVGASTTTAGTPGLVPGAAAGTLTRFLCVDGTFKEVSAGATWGGIGGSISAQTDLKAALDLKQDAASAPLTKRYTSPAQQFVAGGQFTLTHNLGKEVAVVEAWMRCKTAELGYSVGDKLPYPAMGTDNGGSTGLSTVCTSSTATVGMGASSFTMLHKTSRTTTFFTAANWEIYLELLA
ncbi:hypothetical protein K5F93_11700 [Pseudomonas protegens]|uniref:pyocin knob domain-containing protein n=1 Tax=Pseudomonas protegens TaxID=380021 RepID=UPI001C8D7A8F|nr:pyocin knob domain-containing protein [Pseudomonas protegens]QZI72890.1 hypothetical protein K5F93_11700 [Pseudomonas protegens]